MRPAGPAGRGHGVCTLDECSPASSIHGKLDTIIS